MKITDQQQKLLFNAAIFIAVYLLLGNPVLKALGLKKSNEEKNIEGQRISPTSIFHPAFWRQYFYVGSGQPNGRTPMNQLMIDRAKKNAVDIHKAFGLWIDDFSAIKLVFNNCPTQSDVSLLASTWGTTHNKSFFSFLENGFDIVPHNGLSDKQLSEIINYVNKLPVK